MQHYERRRHGFSHALAVALTALTALATAMAPGTAGAQDLDKIGRDLLAQQAEVRRIGQQVRAPQQLGRRGNDLAERRLISAQVAFGIGNYDDAAILLYDLVEKGPGSRSYDDAVYYLAESLFFKRDFIGAQAYFTKLVDTLGTNSQFYQQSLERLVELSLKVEGGNVEEYLAKLDQVPRDQLKSSVPYVRGRYLYFKDDPTGAIESFRQVPRNSEYSLRAQYFVGASQLAVGNLGDAATTYQALLRTPPQAEEDKRVIELAHMALGRIFYERDQPTEALDQYLAISRKSDLFDDALFEIAWVYVNAQKFEQALRALELLALANPSSARLPDVRVLEGNLRIRRAQRFEETGQGNPSEQYAAAMTVFEDTRDRYEGPLKELEQIIAERPDPRTFVNQITGRSSETFDVGARLPDEAVAWLREEPEVDRVVTLDQDLVTIGRDLLEAEANVARLEGALKSGSSVNIFPSLAEKRARLTEIQEALYASRRAMVVEETRLAGKYANADEKARLQQLARERQALGRRIDALPGATLSYGERVRQAREKYDELAKESQELSVVIDNTEATLAALDKYLRDAERGGAPTEETRQYADAMADLRRDLDALKQQMATLGRDITLARDQAGVGDAQAQQASRLRSELADLLERERATVAQIRGRANGSDGQRLTRIEGLTARIIGVQGEIAVVDRNITKVVDVALAEVRTSVVEEKQRIAEYRAEMQRYESEAQVVGGDVLGTTFGRVSKKFYNVLVRSDVGTTDVAWANKERTEDTLKRLRLEESKEKRRLTDEFREIIEERRKLDAEAKEGGN